MALKIKWARPTAKSPKAATLLRIALIAGAAFVVVGCTVFVYFYFTYQHVVDERLKQPIFANTAKIYAAPREVRPGQKLSVRLLANELREAGYSADGAAQASQLGTYSQGAGSITVHPGPQSYHAQDGATIHIGSGVVESISDDHGEALASYELEPLLITGLSEDANRTKRRLLTYDEIPPNIVHAVLAIEDRRFFEHSGVNYFSMASWAWHDLIGDRKHRGGASTLTMQLAKLLFLSDDGTIKYKLVQILITFQLEHRFTKNQIFEMYANQIPLGQRGSFSIDGFGEASQVYFGKDVSQLNLAECAFLAGIIQRPSYFNPFHHPDRTIERRNLVLDSMVETGSITKEQAERAKAEPLHLTEASVDASEAPYFVDLVHDQLLQKLGERDFNREGLRIYTSLDPDLQREATAAVDSTIHVVDGQVDRVHAKQKKPGEPYAYPQVALIALNPHTGQVLALVGGRSYGSSQVNHAVAHRPTGSIFKPFVYAAAFQTALEGTMLPGQTKLFSPVTMISDEQTTYDVGDARVHAAQLSRRVLRPDYGALCADAIGQQRHHQPGQHGRLRSRGSAGPRSRHQERARDARDGHWRLRRNAARHGRRIHDLRQRRHASGPLDAGQRPHAHRRHHRRLHADFQAGAGPARGLSLTTSMMEDVLHGNGQDPCIVGGRDYCGTGAGVRNMGFLSPAAEKPAPTTMHGSRALPAICFASCGWATTTIPRDPENRGRIRALRRPHPSGPSS